MHDWIDDAGDMHDACMAERHAACSRPTGPCMADGWHATRQECMHGWPPWLAFLARRVPFTACIVAYAQEQLSYSYIYIIIHIHTSYFDSYDDDTLYIFIYFTASSQLPSYTWLYAVRSARRQKSTVN